MEKSFRDLSFNEIKEDQQENNWRQEAGSKEFQKQINEMFAPDKFIGA